MTHSGDGRWAVFRCDAGKVLGGGHVQRSMTLARGLAAAGWRIGFAVSTETTALVPALTAHGWRVETGYDVPADEPARLIAQWPAGIDVLVVDHYRRDADFERPLAHHARCRFVIDDLADRPHDCEMLLDTTVARKRADYGQLIGAQSVMLAGAEFALLRDEFRAAADMRSGERHGHVGEVRTVLLAFGMTDLGGITERVARLLLPRLPDVRFEAIVGPAAEGRAALLALAEKEPRLVVHVSPPDVARIMARADLAVGAGGQTTFERCCLGLPTVALSIADNQIRPLQLLEERGALVHVPAYPAFDEAALIAAVDRLASDAEARREMAVRAIDVCDGRGVERVVAKIAEHARRAVSRPASSIDEGGPDFVLRPATMDDARRIFEWRTDPTARAMSKDTTDFSYEQHLVWFTGMMSDPTRRQFIAEVAGEPCGSVRADLRDGVSVLSWMVSPAHGGRGIGSRMVSAFAETIPGTVHAEMKVENMPSIRIAERAGLTRVGEKDGMLLYARPTRRFEDNQ